ncbi:MAG TPA: dihydrodipicolinate synthase family protein [Baekduia sp.]
MRFPGIIPAVVTPFTDEDAIDVPALRANVQAMLDAGVSGLVANGTMGEAGSLDLDERRRTVEECVALAGGRVPVIAGVSGTSTAVAHGHAERARAAGADAVMCLPPYNYNGTPRELTAFYAGVAEAGLPIMAYNNPGASGVDLTPEVLARIGAEVEGVVAVKECSGDARRIATLVGTTDLEILVGGDDWALEGIAAGATGWISGVANVAPAECLALHTLTAEGRLPEARALYQRLLPLARLDMTPLLVQYFKGAMDAVGLRGGPVRPPRLALDAPEQAILDAAVAALRQPVAA